MIRALVTGQPISLPITLPAVAAYRPKNAREWLICLSALWMALLVAFNLLPSLDVDTSSFFFRQTVCPSPAGEATICGFFPDSRHGLLITVRQIFFYAPAVAALLLLARLMENFQHHGATYCRHKTRRFSIALIAFAAGPLFLVNGIIKEWSERPRPRQTDLFGGSDSFVAAGDFHGACMSNCSFVSGEAAGAGWLACLVLFLPKPLRPFLGPPIVVLSLLSPYLRLAFGGHYLSDVMLGWLSSLVVYAAVATYFEMSQQKIKVG